MSSRAMRTTYVRPVSPFRTAVATALLARRRPCDGATTPLADADGV